MSLPDAKDVVGKLPVTNECDQPQTCAPAQDCKRRTIWFHLKTLFLFTKSDFKTVVFPQSLFAIAVALSKLHASSPNRDILQDYRYLAARLPDMLLWIWLHLLTEDISNQRQRESILEDAVNKPWRPITSGRISTLEAQSVLQVLVPSTLIISFLLGSFTPSVTIMTFIWLYNDLDGSSSGPWQRNAINAIALACFGWGASEVLTAKMPMGADDAAFNHWYLLMVAVVTTTVHAQDLPDLEGDRVRGRKTMPLLYGEIWIRGSLAILAPVWSVVCSYFWGITNLKYWIVPLSVGCLMAVCTMFARKQSTDELVWKLWCLWITIIYALPLVALY